MKLEIVIERLVILALIRLLVIPKGEVIVTMIMIALAVVTNRDNANIGY